MFYLIVSIIIATFFYVLFPILGYILSTKSWNKVLHTIVASRFSPIITEANKNFPELFFNKSVRYFGKIEHISEDTSAKGNMFSFFDGENHFSIKKSDTKCYYLKDEKRTFSSHSLESIAWSDFIACNRGVRVFIVANLEHNENEKKKYYTLTKSSKSKIILVFYEPPKTFSINSESVKNPTASQIIDAAEEDAFANSKDSHQKYFWQSVLHSSPKKSYWKNNVSLGSLSIGFFAILATILPLFIPDYQLQAMDAQINFACWGFTLLFLPVIAILPPGIFLGFVSNFYIKKATSYLYYSRMIENLVFGISESKRIAKLADGTTYELRSVEKTNILPIEMPKSIRNGILRNETEDWFVCGIKTKNECSEVSKPNDPFFEVFSIPASPLHLIRTCNQKALLCKLLAWSFLTLGVIANFFLAYKLIFLWSYEV